jgi:branched-subunit amino acid ABC-type transport system permease component
MNLFTQTIISGLMSGATYTLLGVGLVLVFRTARILNLAHGESFVLAAVITAVLVGVGLPVWLAILSGVLAALLFTAALHHFVLRQRASWPQGTLILITLAVAFAMRGLMFVLIGPNAVSFPSFFLGPPWRIAGGVLSRQGAALMVVGLGTSIAVGLFLSYTRLGKQLLATAENPQAAELLGVDVGRARLLAYGLSGALAGIAAVLLVPLISIDFQSGLSMTLRGFIAAAIAGMSPVGTIASGVALGMFESMVGSYVGVLLQDPVIFFLLIIVAIWQSRRIRFGGGRRA